ncbi:MAG: TasA family protein, partial [Bacillota bacterium]
MNEILRKLSSKSLKKYLFFAIVMFFIAAISTVGVTYAWFTTRSITIENVFTAGTVEIEAEDITEVEGAGSDTDIISPGDSLEKSYRITNVGS